MPAYSTVVETTGNERREVPLRGLEGGPTRSPSSRECILSGVEGGVGGGGATCSPSSQEGVGGRSEPTHYQAESAASISLRSLSRRW